MHDMLPQPQGDASGAALADVGVTPSELKAALSAVLSEFAWQLEQITLSRRGLAGIVELIGSTDHARSPGDAAALRSEAIAAEGNAILSHVLGSADRSRARSARLPSGGLAWGDGRSSAARLGGDRHGRARRPRAPRPGRSPEHPAAARTPEPRQSPCRPCRYPAPGLWGGSLCSSQAAARGAPKHCPRSPLPSAKCAGLVPAIHACPAALEAAARIPRARIACSPSSVRRLETAGTRRGAAAVIARTARAAHPLADRRAIAAPAAAVFEGSEVAPCADRCAHGGCPRRAAAAAVVVVVEQAGPASDPHPGVHAGEPRVLRHGSIGSRQCKRQRACTPQSFPHGHPSP